MNPHELFGKIRKSYEFTVIVYLFATIILSGVAYLQGWIFCAFTAGFFLGRTISAIGHLRRTITVQQMISSGDAEIVMREKK